MHISMHLEVILGLKITCSTILNSVKMISNSRLFREEDCKIDCDIAISGDATGVQSRKWHEAKQFSIHLEL